MKSILIGVSFVLVLVSCTSKTDAPVDLNNLKTQGCSIEKPTDCEEPSAEDLLNGNSNTGKQKEDPFNLKK